MVSDPNANAVTHAGGRQSDPTDSGYMAGSTVPDSLYNSPTPPPTVVRRPPPPVPRKLTHLVDPFGSSLLRLRTLHLIAVTSYMGQQQHLPSQQYPDSSSSLALSIPTPQRINAVLGRRQDHVVWDADLANVPPPERSIDDYHSGSIGDLSRYTAVGDRHAMAPFVDGVRDVGEGVDRKERATLKDTPLARKKAKDVQNRLTGVLGGGTWSRWRASVGGWERGKWVLLIRIAILKCYQIPSPRVLSC
jgi:hypothetical protein